MGKQIVRHEARDSGREGIPPLQNGDRLSRDEFERRYEAMPDLRTAELIEGVVYVPSPVNQRDHGKPHLLLVSWVGHYLAAAPSLDAGCDATTRLDQVNEPQPDVHLRIPADLGGQSRLGAKGYLEGAPDLIVEVSASSASYDLHPKLEAYRRNGVREYLVLRVHDREVDWFALREGRYEKLAPDGEGIIRSGVFPGLWLDAPALLRGDLPRLIEVLGRGLKTPEHAAFAARLKPGS